MNHTPGHRDCAACRQKAYTTQLKLSHEKLFPDAAKLWIQSREFTPGSGRSRLVSGRSLEDFEQYRRALGRFFGELPLNEIHLGHIRQYQEDRASGVLGPTREELFPRFVKRLAKQLGVTEEEVQANADMLAIVAAEVETYPQREVSPQKVNQEVAMLIRILKVAGLWTSEDDENYEPLQHVESDIPRSLTPEEQERFLQIAKRVNELVYCYSVLGIHATLSTVEERRLTIGDINIDNGILLVRSRSAKNKYRVRTIPLTDEACWAAKRLIEKAGERRSISPQHFLFPFRNARDQFNPDKPMTVSGLKRPWNEIRVKAGVPWFTPYGLRHTGCTRFAEDGMSIHVLLSMAGHMSRKMQQHYIHISEVAKKRAVKHAYRSPWEDRKQEKMRAG